MSQRATLLKLICRQNLPGAFSGQRTIAATTPRMQPTVGGNGEAEQVRVTFLKPGGERLTVQAKEGKSLFEAVEDNNLDIDGFGACKGSLCCTTCHLIFKQSDYEKLARPNYDEEDMLERAYGLTDTSRLGCQVILKRTLDPLEVQVPTSYNDDREE